MNEHDLAITAGCVGGPHVRGEQPETCEECVPFSTRSDMLYRALAAEHEVERLRQGLWDCAIAAGMDHDGDLTPKHLAAPDIVELALREVRELRLDSNDERSGYTEILPEGEGKGHVFESRELEERRSAAIAAGVNAVQEEFDERRLGDSTLIVEVILDESGLLVPAPEAVERAARALVQIGKTMSADEKLAAFQMGDRAVARALVVAALANGWCLALERGDVDTALRELRKYNAPGRRLNDDFLRAVARKYEILLAEGERYPAKALAKTQHADKSTVSRWIKAARERGLIGGVVS